MQKLRPTEPQPLVERPARLYCPDCLLDSDDRGIMARHQEESGHRPALELEDSDRTLRLRGAHVDAADIGQVLRPDSDCPFCSTGKP